MRRARRQVGNRPIAARGFGMVEAVISTVIVSVMLVSALNAVGATARAELVLARQDVSLSLAQDLMAEILQTYYEAPDFAPGSFGRSAAEAAAGNRSLFDDVDDFHGWSASPPEYADGSAIPGVSGYARQVKVTWVNALSPDVVSLVDTGVKQITVTVLQGTREIVSLQALRTRALADPVAEPAATKVVTK